VHRLSEYYQEVLGFAVQAQARDMVFLSCPLDHHSVVLKKGQQSHCPHLGLEVASDDDLTELRRRLESREIKVSEATDPAPSVERRVSFAGPSNLTIEVQVEAAVSPPDISKTRSVRFDSATSPSRSRMSKQR